MDVGTCWKTFFEIFVNFGGSYRLHTCTTAASLAVQPLMHVRSTCIGRNATPSRNHTPPATPSISDVIAHRAGGCDVTVGTCDVIVGGARPHWLQGSGTTGSVAKGTITPRDHRPRIMCRAPTAAL